MYSDSVEKQTLKNTWKENMYEEVMLIQKIAIIINNKQNFLIHVAFSNVFRQRWKANP